MNLAPEKMFVHKCRESKSARNPNVCKSPKQKQTSPHLCVNPSSPLACRVFTYMWLGSRFPLQFRADAAALTVLNHPATLRLIHRKPPLACNVGSGRLYVCVGVCVSEGIHMSPSTCYILESRLCRVWSTEIEGTPIFRKVWKVGFLYGTTIFLSKCVWLRHFSVLLGIGFIKLSMNSDLLKRYAGEKNCWSESII